MVAVNQDAAAAGASIQTDIISLDAAVAADKKDDASPSATSPDSDSMEPKGDPDMAPVFLRLLVPDFTQVFQSAMLQSVRWITLVISLESWQISNWSESVFLLLKRMNF